jgi:hypothetical protein
VVPKAFPNIAIDALGMLYPASSAACGTLAHDYKRNGTTTLFAH